MNLPVIDNQTYNSTNYTTNKLAKAEYIDCTFTNCKLVGVLFQNCNDFLLAFSFMDCTLNLSSFYKVKISNTTFLNCKMHSVDFTESEAKNTSFLNCDLKDSIFDTTNLENANFLTANNFSIDPSNNKMKKSKFSKDNCLGLLNSFEVIIK